MTDGMAEEINMSGDAKSGQALSIWAKLRIWVASIGARGVVMEEEALKVDKDFIMRVLPHRGRWLLLDAVEITPQKVTGFFTVTKELCEGHAIGEDAVLPGVLLAEIANQLAGIWYATQNPELIGSGKILFARTGDYKASFFIRPGDLLRVEVSYADLQGTMKTTRRGTFLDLSGMNFIFKVGEELVGSVGEVVLKGIESPKTTPPAKTAPPT